ncbi:MAG: hypothetical protein QOJ98_1073 [Acidobacteriota bacterium]|jgi:hypothetical protein|nr:hypothetical protein [Acidobacteriota bacterium]
MSDAEYDGRSVVYLLHGVDTTLLQDGTPYWYRHVMSVVHPFFRCVPLRYTAYDKGGKRHVATWGGGFAIALGVFAASFVIGWSGMPIIGATATGTAAVGGMALSIHEWIRRSKTADAVAADCSGVNAKTLVPSHVIAHSFGTYLLKRVLDEVELRLKHVVLVGSALSRWTDWERLWNLRHALKKPFVCIRNEYSPKDMSRAGRAMRGR